jgi:predicted RNA-binding protein with PUA domain
METAWLLDDGRMCVGVCGNRLKVVCYTDPSAVRFSRKQDAEMIGNVLAPILGVTTSGNNYFQPIEHSWG